MSHNELIVHGYIRLTFEHCDASKCIPFDINIIDIFCDYFGYDLCCIAVTKHKEVSIQYPNLSTPLTEFFENSKPFRLNEIKNVETEINITTALYTAISVGHISCFKYLSPKHDYPTIDGYGALWIAARCNQPQIIKLLLQTGLEEMDPNTTDKNLQSQVTPLMIACEQGSGKAVNVLLNCSNININAKSAHNGKTALNMACFDGHIQCIKQILNYEDVLVDELTTNGRSPIWYASFFGYYEIIDLLLNYSSMINLNRCSKKGFTAIFVAAQNGHVNVVKLLLKNNADPSIKDMKEHDPLWIASLRGHLDVVRVLISHPKVQIDEHDISGVTPLWAASQNGFNDIVELLLNPNELSDDDKNNNVYDDDVLAIYQSAVYGNQQILLANQKKYEQILSKRIVPADPNIVKEDGCAPIWVAASKGHLECVQTLIKYGADPNLASNEGVTPFFVACQEGRKDVVDLFLKMNCVDINRERDEDGSTPIMIAANNGHTEIVKELLKYGVDVKTINKTGSNAVHLCAISGHMDIIKLLHEYLKENGEKKEDIATFMNEEDYRMSLTPLMFACCNGYEDMVKYLVNNLKVNILKASCEEKTAMDYAVDNGYQNRFRWLSLLINKNTKTSDDQMS